MNDYNFYIENYFINHFKNMKNEMAIRDYILEEKITETAKIEYLLQRSFWDGTLYKIFKPEGKTFDGKHYQIQKTRFKNDFIIKYDEGTSMRGEDIFKLLQVHSSRLSFYVPILDLFNKIKDNKENIEVSRQRLKAIFSDELRSLNLKTIPQYALDKLPKDTLYRNIIHDYYEPNESVQLSYYINYFGNNKIIIPFFYADEALNTPFCFYPTVQGEKSFFNKSFLKNNKNAIVIITDSIELAGRNQNYINTYGIEDIVWISYYKSGTNDFFSFDWSLLKERNVYYILKEHSGHGTKQIFERADAVKKQVNTVFNVKFNYISFLSDYNIKDKQSTYSSPIPIILTEEELEQRKKNSCSIYHNYREFNNNLSQIKVNERPLLSPLIYRSTTSLFYGNKKIDKTLLLLQIAFSISQGATAFQGWSANMDTPILYLKGVKQLINFEQNLNDTFKIFSPKNKFDQSFEKLSTNNSNIPKTFPINTPLHSTTIKKNFYWNVLDIKNISNNLLNSNAIDFINMQTKEIEKILPNYKVLVLDSLFDDIFENNVDTIITSLKFLIAELHKNNWSVIIVSTNKRDLSIKIDFDNIIKIANEKTNSDYSININIEKSIKRLSKNNKQFSCKADLSSNNPKFIRTRESSKKWTKWKLEPREKLIKRINNLSEQGIKIREIAKKLEITESLVKQLKDKKYKFTKPEPESKKSKIIKNQ